MRFERAFSPSQKRHVESLLSTQQPSHRMNKAVARWAERDQIIELCRHVSCDVAQRIDVVNVDDFLADPGMAEEGAGLTPVAVVEQAGSP